MLLPNQHRDAKRPVVPVDARLADFFVCMAIGGLLVWLLVSPLLCK